MGVVSGEDLAPLPWASPSLHGIPSLGFGFFFTLDVEVFAPRTWITASRCRWCPRIGLPGCDLGHQDWQLVWPQVCAGLKPTVSEAPDSLSLCSPLLLRADPQAIFVSSLQGEPSFYSAAQCRRGGSSRCLGFSACLSLNREAQARLQLNS